MRNMLAAIAVLVLLAGCVTPQGAQYREAAARTADEILAATEWGLCNAMTVGAVKRRYGHIPAKVAAFNLLCSEAPTGPFFMTKAEKQ